MSEYLIVNSTMVIYCTKNNALTVIIKNTNVYVAIKN